MSSGEEVVPEDHPHFIGPVLWNRDHLMIVKDGTTAINEWRKQNPDETLHLEGAHLFGAQLEGADLINAQLEGANFGAAGLEGACLLMASVDGSTHMSDIDVTDDTDITGVGLGVVRIEPHVRSQLEYNIRRIGWQSRYQQRWWLRFFPGSILWLSRYGSASHRLVGAFLFFAFIFAAIYLIPTQAPRCDWWPTFEIEPFVDNLEVFDESGDYRLSLTWLRAAYFSVVTMTTLGFGDLYAHPQSVIGHILLMLQVLIGYVLLGALITRFAILFQSVE